MVIKSHKRGGFVVDRPYKWVTQMCECSVLRVFRHLTPRWPQNRRKITGF